MSITQISYKSGYKYQLEKDYAVQVNIVPSRKIKTAYIELDVSNNLVIKKGYAWDGPSEPAIDTRNFMRSSLVHDSLFQLMRNRLLDPNKFRDEADTELVRIYREDGMSCIRAWWVHKSVHYFAEKATNYATRKKILIAP